MLPSEISVVCARLLAQVEAVVPEAEEPSPVNVLFGWTGGDPSLCSGPSRPDPACPAREDANSGAPRPVHPQDAVAVQPRPRVLLLHRFLRWLFNRGALEGPRLLLQMLRGEQIDWPAYSDARRTRAKCQACHQVRELDCFAAWERFRANFLATCHIVTCARVATSPSSHGRLR